ncbi:hypothetical protein DXG01_006097 [Tephrocybe rancida]|nr:hypothetical protein DXG01_006097 [Tephrocybe rancida]
MFTSTHSNSAPYDSFPFIPPTPGYSRSPCPALNALANHGYIPRNGTRIPFWTLLTAVRHVYNLSLPLSLVLTTVGFLTCGTISLFPPKSSEPSHNPLSALAHFLPCPSWTLKLASLCTPGALKIAHNASLVHNDVLGSAADPVLVAQLLELAQHKSLASISGCSHQQDGASLSDLGRLHEAREATLAPSHKLSRLHEQVALGECGLAWCVMHAHDGSGAEQKAIPLNTLKQWFGEERLPDGWWDLDGGRPTREVGLKEAGQRAAEVGLFRDRT